MEPPLPGPSPPLSRRRGSRTKPDLRAMNPALTAFLAALDAETVLGQVLIRRVAHGFELRHVADRVAGTEGIELLTVSGLRALAQFTSTGAFRPLKSAPNLRRGWRAMAA